ncbi:lysine-specific demethylase 2B-like isoform X2 [Varroa destructor]|uniref:[histone H3]-dimethyl-L-lysine(36) demethylase n=1 Tax=Varroa destructor TaxID=109461 RepID=A0A7M7KLP4_VARDE|nr:lysine-specific demethylase 2B-like isoform X2 [Varroa destructor]
MRVKERKHYTDDLGDEFLDGGRTFTIEDKLTAPEFGAYFVKEMASGADFSLAYFQEHGFEEPLLFKDKTNLGMRLPSEKFNVNDVRMCVGSRRRLDVMDVITQKNIEMTMKEWCKYMNTPAPKRDRLLNVISLEFSHTKLENYVESPTVVRQVDWIDVAWPRHLKESQTEATNSLDDMKYPKVQKYCLMSVAGCYTDFHIDFGGTSVWYHILWGKKIFWLIPPTETNLKLYESWVLSGKQGDIFFGQSVEKCARIELNAGETFFIPTGWIHAVYTPVDTLVFGGNFLHSFGIEKQLRISQIEDTTRVPHKFRYPFYTEMLWYVLQRYVMCLTGRNHLSCDEEGKPVSINCLLAPKPRPEMESVRLTRRELVGLSLIVDHVQRLPLAKRGCPDLLRDPNALLQDASHVIALHLSDDARLAITGQPVLTWPEGAVKRRPLILQTSGGPKRPQAAPRTPKGQQRQADKDQDKARRRRTRCRKCDACLRTDCGDCHFCKDMRKFGGPGRMKQSCLARQCMAPVLPHTAQCTLCKTERPNQLAPPGVPPPDDGEVPPGQLMECVQCWEIVHPDCLINAHPEFTLSDGLLNEDLPNSWDCPKCCREGKPEQAKTRHTKGGGGKGNPRVTPFVRYDESPPEKKLKLEDGPATQPASGQRQSVLENLSNKIHPITPKCVVRPVSYLETPLSTASAPGTVTREGLVYNPQVILPIMQLLSVRDLHVCAQVCKRWNELSLHPSLWKHMDLAKNRLTSKSLVAIVRRQPALLNVSWTSLSRDQMDWLLPRIPATKGLYVRGLAIASLKALNAEQGPQLRFLDLSWVDGLDDERLKELLLPEPPGGDKHASALADSNNKRGIDKRDRCWPRLRALSELKLCGNPITDSGVRSVCQYLVNLQQLDLSNCNRVTDLSLMMLASKLHSKLMRLVVSHCPQVTDAGLEALKMCTKLECIDARGCSKVTEDGIKRLLVCMPSLNSIREGKLVTAK